MTKLLEQALEAARVLPAQAQDDIARVVLHLAGQEEARGDLVRRRTGGDRSLEGPRHSGRVRDRRTGAGCLGQARAVKFVTRFRRLRAIYSLSEKSRRTHAICLDHAPAGEVVEIPPGVLRRGVPVGASGAAGRWQRCFQYFARRARHFLDALGLDRRGRDASLHDHGGASRGHAETARMVR